MWGIYLDRVLRELLKRVEKDLVAVTSCENAKNFGRLKKIRELREKDLIFIGNDRKKNKSIIYKKPSK